MPTSETRQNSKLPGNIELLPEHLVDQIKAGEVVERPASLVKELVENAIDAGANDIHLHIVENGMDLISIEDNGQGMEHDELPLAFARHATSKIRRFEDLYALGSFGFRGEALASIASTARVTCTSTPEQESKDGGKIVYHGGKQVSLAPWRGHRSGTTITINDLFYNTPARLKFIKSGQSERNALKRMLSSFILANPRVSFSIKWDEKDKEFYPALKTSDPKSMEERVKKVLFTRKAENDELLYFEGEYEGHKAQGYVSRFSNRSPSGKSHYLFANRRTFQDKGLHKAVINTCERLWGPGETGHYCIMLEVPVNQIDVNVHPNKTHIKFFNSGVLFSTLTAALKKRLDEELKKTPTENSSPVTGFEEIFPPQTEESRWEDFRTQYETPSTSTPTSFIEKKAASGPLELKGHLYHSFLLIYHRDNETYYLCELSRLLVRLWQNVFSKAPFTEEQTSPLLISEPVYVNSLAKEKLNLLKSYGLELEKVDESMYALRTVPSLIQTLPVGKYIVPFIKSIAEESAPTQSTQALFDWLYDHPPTTDELPIQLSWGEFEALTEGLSFFDLPKDTIKEIPLKKLKTIFFEHL